MLIGGAVLLLADKLTGGDGIAGLAAATTAGNAAVVPTIVAQANPVYAPAAESATVLVAASVVVTAILCPIITVLWARVVLKQPAGGSREVEAALAADLHVHLDHVPADTGETALEAAHVKVSSTPLRTDRPTATAPGPPTAGSGHGGRQRTSGTRVDQRPDEPTAGPHRPQRRRPKGARSRCVTSEWCAAPTTSSRRSSRRRAAAILAGEQSSGTFVSVPGETAECTNATAPRSWTCSELGRRSPSLPSRTRPEKVHAARVVVEWPMENIGTDLATLQTTIAGNLFELQELFACRVLDLQLPGGVHRRAPGAGLRCPRDAAS